MHGAVVSGGVGVLAGKEQGVRNRCRKGGLAAFASDLDVAVGATRKRVSVPVVKVGSVQLRVETRFVERKKVCERLDGFVNDVAIGHPGPALGAMCGRPSSDDWKVRGHLCPPGRKIVVVGENGAGVGEILCGSGTPVRQGSRQIFSAPR